VGAAAEIVSSWPLIGIYYDRDGTPGFQWDLSNELIDIFDCTQGTYDCVDAGGSIALASLTWTNIDLTVTNCSVALPAGNYNANCTVRTVHTQGEISPGVPVVGITARSASQSIMINGNLHTPDDAKFDVRINYPYANKTLINATAARVLVVAVHAGKAGTAAGVASINQNGGKAVTFSAGVGGKSAFFAYKPNCTIDAASSAVVTQEVTQAQVNGWVGGVGGTSVLMNVYLKPGVLYLSAFGWQTHLTLHSFPSNMPIDVFWDPQVGVQNVTVTSTQNSPAAFIVPSALLALALALFA